MLLYVTALVSALSLISIWDITQLKNTILWVIFVASVTLFRGNQGIDDPYYVNTAIKDNFKIITALEFIVNFHSFGFFAELVLIPIATIIGMVHAFSEAKSEYATAHKLSESLLIIIGSSFLIYAFYNIANDINHFADYGTLIDFSLPIILSVSFLPFMFIAITYLAYERVFTRLGRVLNDNLVSYAKYSAVTNFLADRVLLSRWFNLLYQIDIKSKEDLTNSITKLTEMRAAEKRCDHVDFKDGWSPYIAKRYLSKLGISTKYYEPAYNDQWTSSSDSLSLEDESPILCNNIRYLIEGGVFQESCRLKLKIMPPFFPQIPVLVFLD
jgi:hypothetical protein